MVLEQIVPAFFLVAVLILVLPSFFKLNSQSKLFITNLFIWGIIVVSIVIVSYLIFKWKKQT